MKLKFKLTYLRTALYNPQYMPRPLIKIIGNTPISESKENYRKSMRKL